MKNCFLSIVLLISVISCDKSSPSYQIVPASNGISAKPVVTFIDSTLLDRPQLGDANTVLNFPFGLGSRIKDDIRLIAIKNAGKPYQEYKYDDEGRLIEKIGYYSIGGQIASSTRYEYAISGISKIEYWGNVAGVMIESYPTTSELRLLSHEIFSNGNSEAVLDKTFQKTEFQGSYYSPEPMKIGFDKNGQKVWEARTNGGEIIMDYWVFNRDKNKNISFVKWRRNFDYEIGNQTTYTYDTKGNPYATTGDAADWRSSNPNNILREEFLNNMGNGTSTHYEYLYRNDGYPSRLINAENKELSLEFIYNK